MLISLPLFLYFLSVSITIFEPLQTWSSSDGYEQVITIDLFASDVLHTALSLSALSLLSLGLKEEKQEREERERDMSPQMQQWQLTFFFIFFSFLFHPTLCTPPSPPL